jgi:hypothetical protein
VRQAQLASFATRQVEHVADQAPEVLCIRRDTFQVLLALNRQRQPLIVA